MGQRGRAGWIHAHDKEWDEDHPQAGEEEQAASRPVVRQRCQNLELSREGGRIEKIMNKISTSGNMTLNTFENIIFRIKTKMFFIFCPVFLSELKHAFISEQNVDLIPVFPGS